MQIAGLALDALLVAVAVAVVAVAVVALRHHAKTSDTLRNTLMGLAEGITAVSEAMVQLGESSGADGTAIARIEELERRVAVVHDDALRYMKRGSTALARAQKVRGEDEDDEPDPQTVLALQEAARAELVPEATPANGNSGDPVLKHKLRRYRA